MEIGAQLYTVRDFCKNLDDLSQTLKKIADIGYRNVQISGTCAYEAEWLKKELDKNGLKCVLTHIPANRLQNETLQVIAEHRVFGCNNIGLGWNDFKEENVKSLVQTFVDTYKPVARVMRENGAYFMYHNHGGEFIRFDGKTVLSHLAERFDEKELGFTLDTYWVQVGGADPAAYLEKLLGRVPCIHLKDYKFGQKMAVVGEGNINFDRVFEKAESAGTQYMLVEQDDCYGEDPFDCLKRSYENLRSFGFR